MMKRLTRVLLTVGFIGLFIYFYASNPESLSVVSDAGMVVLAAAIIYQLTILFIGDLLTKTLVDRLSDRKLSIVDGYYSAFISSFGNYFLPLTGGAFLRALFLKRQHDFSYKKFISISYGSYIISFFVIFGVSLLALIYLFIKDAVFIPSLFLIVLAVFLASLSLMSKNVRLDILVIRMLGSFKFGRRAAKILEDISSGWQDIIHTPGLTAKMLLLTLANLFVRAIFYYIVFTALGSQTNLLFMLIFTSLISISLYITITPGSVGIRESLLVFYSKSMNLEVDHVLAVNLIDRISLVFALILLLVIFEFFLKRRIIDILRPYRTGKK